jgi:cation transport regulator
MPYANNDELPPPVRHVLPAHAQDIFRAAFNNAHDRYADEDRARRVAWSAVKRRYEKVGDTWIEKPPH